MTVAKSVHAFVGRQSLRRRLTALLIALLLVGCAAIGIATTLAVRSFLLTRLDQQLQQAGQRYATALEHSDGDADNAETSTIGQPIGTLGARTLNGTVTAIGVISESSKPVQISAADRAAVSSLKPSGRNRTVELPTLGKYRLEVSAGQDGDTLVTGLPLRVVDDTLHRVVLAETVVFVVVVALIGIIGGVAVRLSLRPLERVTRTALRVSDLPLATGDGRLPERVPPSDERTEVGQVAAAVNHMLEQVEAGLIERQRSEDRLRRFVADASHELRTPLAVVRSHSELIGHSTQELPEVVRQSLRRIEQETARMGRLVDDLLLLARLDSGGELEHQEVDLSRQAIDAIDDARVVGTDHRWSLDLPAEPVQVLGDAHRLHQVISNLLSNARNHTPAGTHVELSLQVSGARAVLIVSDDGPGIPQQLLPNVQQRFVRGDTARSHQSGNTGLGLAIVAGVIAAHGGTVAIDSSSRGTTVTVELPAEQVAASAPATID